RFVCASALQSAAVTFSSAVSGSNMVPSGIMRLDAEHLRDGLRRLDLREVREKGGERYRVATTLADGEIAPPAGPQIDLEGAEMLVGAAGIAGDILTTLDLATG